MAVNWLQYHEKDGLNHVSAILKQQSHVISTMSKNKSRAQALQLQTMLNNFFGTKKTALGMNAKANQGIAGKNKIQSAVSSNLNSAQIKNIENTLTQALQTQLNSQNLVVVNPSKLDVVSKNVETQMQELNKTRSQIMEVSALLEDSPYISAREAELFMQTISKIERQLNTLNKNVNLTSNIQENFNKTVDEVKIENLKLALTQNAKNLVQVINAQAHHRHVRKLHNVVFSSLQGSKVGFQIEGLDKMNITDFNDLNKDHRWQLDENGYMIYSSPSENYGNIAINLGSNEAYYVNVTNTLRGGQGAKSFATKTPLFYFLEQDLFIEEFTRAYLRYAGWKWVNTRPYEGQALYNMTNNVLGILAIQNGLKSNGNDAEILIMSRRDKPGFQCYSIADIADRVMSYSGINNNIRVSHLPAQGDLRPRPIRSNFLSTYVNVNVNNLQKLVAY